MFITAHGLTLVALVGGFVVGFWLTNDDGASFYYSASDLEDTTGLLLTKEATATARPNDQTPPAGIEQRVASHKRQHKPRNLTQAELQQWCPTAKCRVTDLCHPCQRRFLIVLATAQSASTSLQWMLDSLPGVRLSGENDNIVARTQEVTEYTLNFLWYKENHQSWKHEDYPKPARACVVQKLVETINPPPSDAQGWFLDDDNDDQDTIVGFKTVLFQRRTSDGARMIHKDMFQKRVRFLRMAFPCARFVLNIRSDVEAQAQSQLRHAVRKPGDAAALRQENDMLIELAQNLGPQKARILDSAVWTRNVTAVNDVVDWLGFDRACHFAKPFHVTDAAIEGTRSTPPGCHKLAA